MVLGMVVLLRVVLFFDIIGSRGFRKFSVSSFVFISVLRFLFSFCYFFFGFRVFIYVFFDILIGFNNLKKKK